MLALVFPFGGLLGRFFIFYSLSGSLSTSWPFLIFLGLLFVGNEVLRKRYAIFTFCMVVYFIVLFSFVSFYLPILLGHIGTWVFVLGGLLSLVAVMLFAQALLRRVKNREDISSGRFVASILGVYVLINLMYFANVIPPLPLSLEGAGIYHLIKKTAGGYTGTKEIEPWYARFRSSQVVNVLPGETMYAFSSVFAPTKISTTISHSWQYYDPNIRTWIIKSRLSFPITGGRDGGYRGYTWSSNLTPGDWRVDVLTSGGQIVGRIKFVVLPASSSPQLIDRSL